MAQYIITGTGQTNPDGLTIGADLTLVPAVPTQLGAISWHNASQQVTQFNAAMFASASNQFLSSATDPTWLNGLTKLSFELSFMLKLTAQPTQGLPTPDAVSSGLLGRWHYSDQGQFALDAITNTGQRHLRLYVCNSRTDTSPPAVNGTALILPYHYYHLVVVFDGAQAAADRIKFYLNGALDPVSGGTIPTSLTTLSASTPLHISNTIANGKLGGAGGDGLLDGAVWRVRFWPGVALTSGDAVTLFNNRKGYAFQSIPATISAQPTQAWELNEASGTRASATGGAAMMDNGGVPSTGVTQVGDLTGRGFTGVGIGSLTMPLSIGNLPAFKFPGTISTGICDAMLDIGLPAGAAKPSSCTVAALCSTADITKLLNWVHASYYYPPDPSNAGVPWLYLLNDVNAWGGLILDDNHRLGGTQGTAATFYGNWTGAVPSPVAPTNFGNVAESQTLFANNAPLRLIAVFTAGQALPTLYLNGTSVTMTQSLAGVNGGVYTTPPPTQAAGPAGNSFIGNMADPSYPGQADHYIRDVSLYNVALTPSQVALLDAYLARA